MSFTNSFINSPPVLVPSNHSLYTPSYTADALLPIQCEELDLEPSLPITRKQKLPTSPSVRSSSFQTSPSIRSSSSVPKDPIQYQKLKMNYLRKLNVIPIVSKKDVLAVLGTSKSELPSKKSLNKKSLGKVSKVKTLKREASDSSFVPSFLPSMTIASKPIAIPPRSYSKKLPRVDPSEELEKGDMPGTPGIRAASVIPDHFAVFYRDFEL